MEVENELLLKLLLSEKTKEKCEKKAFEIGKAYFFRTVTYHLTGRVKEQIGDFLILEDVAWIADSGRFTQAINDGVLSEIEPVSVLVRININAITDAFEWKHSLPNTQK